MVGTSWSWSFYLGGACDAQLLFQLRFGHSLSGSYCSTYHNLEVLGLIHLEIRGLTVRVLGRIGRIRFEIHGCSVRDFAVEGPGRSQSGEIGCSADHSLAARRFYHSQRTEQAVHIHFDLFDPVKIICRNQSRQVSMLKDHGHIQREALEDHDWFEELSELPNHNQSKYAGHAGAEKLAELAEHNFAVEELVRIRSKFAVGHIQSEVAVSHSQFGFAVSHSRSGFAVSHIRSGVIVHIQSRLAVGHNQSGLVVGRIRSGLAVVRIQSGLAAIRNRSRLVGHIQFGELVVAVRIRSKLVGHSQFEEPVAAVRIRSGLVGHSQFEELVAVVRIRSRQASHIQSVQAAAADEKWLDHIQTELAIREWKFDHILSKHVGHVGVEKHAELHEQNAVFLEQIDHILSVYVDLVQVEVLAGHIRCFQELSEPSSHTQSKLVVVHIQFEPVDHIQFAFAIRDQFESVVRNQSEELGRNQSRLAVAVRIQSESTDRSQSLSVDHVQSE